jgi:hypothetical protein
MTKLTLALAATAALFVATANWKAEALTGAFGQPAVVKSHSPVQQAGCLLAGRYCGVGSHWVCGLPPNPERRRCHCVPC